MLNMRKWISCLTVATVVSLAAAGNAAADNTPTRSVRAWDLDLTKPGDVAKLYGRVRAAAATVCREETEQFYRTTRMRAPSGWQERCVQDAVDDAVRHVANPALAALHTQAPRVAAEVR
jgi:UrcA family protein